MTPILSLPDEPKYTIKTVASQTGIRAVTLRAWERRQDIPHPYRQSNRYRLYSERDIALLRWLKFQVDHGVPISSAVHELRYLTGLGNGPERIPVAPSTGPDAFDTKKVEQAQIASYTRNIEAALLAQDHRRATDLLQQAENSLDLRAICLEIIDPIQRKINLAWYRDEISAEVWHFSNDLLHARLESFLCDMPGGRLARKVFIACTPMEFFELSPMLLSVLLAILGYQVEYLGPDIALDDIVEYAEEQLPAMVILSSTGDFSTEDTEHLRKLLRGVKDGPIFAFFGQGFDHSPHYTPEVPGIFLGQTVQAASEKVNELLKPRWDVGKKGL